MSYANLYVTVNTMSDWTRQFRSTPLGELITGTAHQPDPTDLTAPLSQRFAGRTVLAVHVALEKAATVRVHFETSGPPRLSGIRNIDRRTAPGFAEILRTEAAAAGADWAIVVFATGWQAVLGQRAARPEASDRASTFARFNLMFESPETVYPRAQADRVYTAVDHPVLDRSVVFSVRRAELIQLLSEVRRSGLEVASVKIAVAAQLELWLARHGEEALTRDVLLTDGLSALLLNVEQRDFVAPGNAAETEPPRQAVQRPSTVEEDIVRFVTGNGSRPLTFIGSAELCTAVTSRVPAAKIVRPTADAAHDAHVVALSPEVRHDLNFEAREVRPPLPRGWRRLLVACAAAMLVLVVLALVNAVYAFRSGYASYVIERDSVQRAAEFERQKAAIQKTLAELANARALRAWVAKNIHAQQLCYAVLTSVPPIAAVDKLSLETREGQTDLTLIVRGDEEAQLSTHRAVENAVNHLRYRIAGEEQPVGAATGGRSYRMHLIVPDAAEAHTP